MAAVVQIAHPLVHHHLAILRDASTRPPEFRRSIHRLSVLAAYEATKDLELQPCEVQTPVSQTTGSILRQRIGLVPILRAGLGMVDPLLDLLPTAEVWHLGLYRDEHTAQPVEYYRNIPATEPVEVALVLDPMLATGGSATRALQVLEQWGVPSTKLVSIIAAPEGIARVAEQFPGTPIYVCAIDERLNSQKFIVPGLGDAGDRTFNTVR